MVSGASLRFGFWGEVPPPRTLLPLSEPTALGALGRDIGPGGGAALDASAPPLPTRMRLRRRSPDDNAGGDAW